MEETVITGPVLIDTGILYALADRKDRWHARAVDFIKGFKGKLIVPATVIPEVCYLLNAHLGAHVENAFLTSLTNRELSFENVSLDDFARCLVILKDYQDLNIGLVDASLIAVAERLKLTRLLTTDRRHFSAIRPKHCLNLLLLP
ncbi:MAG: PIN domain-containing protein [Deltaproteobacteria bacterium]|nr:PIN domain-containing protein [Deltaproteobacteria bacterium]